VRYIIPAPVRPMRLGTGGAAAAAAASVAADGCRKVAPPAESARARGAPVGAEPTYDGARKPDWLIIGRNREFRGVVGAVEDEILDRGVAPPFVELILDREVEVDRIVAPAECGPGGTDAAGIAVRSRGKELGGNGLRASDRLGGRSGGGAAGSETGDKARSGVGSGREARSG